MNNKNLELKPLLNKLKTYPAKLQRYSLISFVIFVGLIYGFVILRINSLRSTEPTTDQVTSQVKAANVPYIDEKIVEQLESLEDNSVNVKALFDEARSNPFQ